MSTHDLGDLGPAYPGELWYSLVARGLRDWAYTNRAAMITRLVGYARRTIDIAFPARPTAIAACLRGDKDLSASDFAARFTLLPYYLAFEKAERRSVMEARFAAGHPRLAQTMCTGNSPLAPSFLRYCPSCRRLAIERYAEAYWHRVHHLPGVEHCVLHGDDLVASTVQYAPGAMNYWAAHRSRCPPGPHRSGGRAKARRFWHAVGRASVQLLSESALACYLSRPELAELVRAAGFGAPGRRIAESQFRVEFTGYLRSEGVAASRFGHEGWWLPAFTNIPGRVYPIQHIVVRRFIGLRLKRRGIEAPHCDRLGTSASSDDTTWDR